VRPRPATRLRSGASVSDKYEFIDEEYATAATDTAPAPSITRMCQWLSVSKSGFYEWRSRPDSATAERRERLRLLIKKAFDDSDGTYGYRRITLQLARWGIRAGAELVRRLMRAHGRNCPLIIVWRPRIFGASCRLAYHRLDLRTAEDAQRLGAHRRPGQAVNSHVCSGQRHASTRPGLQACSPAAPGLTC